MCRVGAPGKINLKPTGNKKQKVKSLPFKITLAYVFQIHIEQLQLKICLNTLVYID